MLLVIIIAGLACVAAGLPVLAVLLVGGITMALFAYGLSRQKTCLHLGIGLAVVSCNHYIAAQLPRPSGSDSFLPAWVEALAQSETFVGAIAVVVILVTAFIGIFGPLRGVPLDMDGVLRQVRQREGKSKDE